MKIIFLDIDGVLIKFGITREYVHHSNKNVHTTFDKDCLEQLVRIVTTTGAMIVLSSNWRRHPHLLNKLSEQFNNIKINVIKLNDYLIDIIKDEGSHGKGDMIMSYIINNFSSTSTPLEKFIVIDDELKDMGPLNRLGYLYKTNTSKGLTELDADRIIAELNT